MKIKVSYWRGSHLSGDNIIKDGDEYFLLAENLDDFIKLTKQYDVMLVSLDNCPVVYLDKKSWWFRQR